MAEAKTLTTKSYNQKEGSSLFLKIKEILGNGQSPKLKDYVKLDSLSFDFKSDTVYSSEKNVQPLIQGIHLSFNGMTNVSRLLQSLDQEIGLADEVEILEVDGDKEGFKEIKKFVLKKGKDPDGVERKPYSEDLDIGANEDGSFAVTMHLRAPFIEVTLKKDDGSTGKEPKHNVTKSTVKM